MAARLAIIDELGFIPGGEQRGAAADMFRRMYWDTALSSSDPVLRLLRDVVGMERVLYGTDFPYMRPDLAVKAKRHIEYSSVLTVAEREAVLGANASRLFPRLRAVTSKA